MNKRLRILSFALLGIALIAFAWWILRDPSDPRYQGKRLSEWLKNYDHYRPSVNDLWVDQMRQTDEAVRNLGTNCIPLLLRLMEAKDSRLKTRMFEFLGDHGFGDISFTSAEQFHYRAFRGFLVLGAMATNAVPQLLSIYSRSTDEQGKALVQECFGFIGPAASNAVPLLMSNIFSADEPIKMTAIRSLGQIHCNPEVVVPKLALLLEDKYPVNQMEAARALEQFGTDAHAVVPKLIELLDHTSIQRNGDLLRALERIDPPAGRKWKQAYATNSTLNLGP